MKTFRANGKLLLTGEYLVLKGAVALALPTQLGQTMVVREDPCPCLETRWNAHHPDGPWFSAALNPKTLEVVETDDSNKAAKLARILKTVQDLNPKAFQPGLHFETHLEFNTEWGLGSSSTLLSLLAQWANINPYQLLNRTIGGSGYDIACATASSAIHYRLEQTEPQIHPISFTPPFADRLFFVYQGKKQHSSEEVQRFNQQWKQDDWIDEVQTITELSMALPTVTYFEDFCTLLQVHENILARCLDREPIQLQYPDFKGTLKSLGAWGGDFLLAATEQPYEQVKAYFQNKGMNTLFKYQDLIL